MELLLVSAVPAIGAGAAFVFCIAAALLMFWAEAWVAARLPSAFAAIPLKSFRKVRA